MHHQVLLQQVLHVEACRFIAELDCELRRLKAHERLTRRAVQLAGEDEKPRAMRTHNAAIGAVMRYRTRCRKA